MEIRIGITRIGVIFDDDDDDIDNLFISRSVSDRVDTSTYILFFFFSSNDSNPCTNIYLH